MKNSFIDVLDGLTEAIYITDLEYNLLYINKAALAIGKRVLQRELENTKCYETLLGRSTPCPFCRIKELSAEQYTIRNFSGATGRVMELRGKLIDWNGVPAHIEYVRDITALNQAEKYSEELKLQQQGLYEHIGIGMCLYQFKNGEIRAVLCNSAYRHLFQLPDEFDTGEPIRLQMKNFIGPGKEELKASIISHIRKKEPFHQVCQIQDQETGLPKSVLMNLECVPQDENTMLWYVSAYDVTAWVESENQLNNVLKSINGGVAVYQVRDDGFLSMLFYTDGLASMHGYSRREYDERIHDDAFQVIFPEDRGRVEKEMKAAVDKKAALNTVYRANHKDKEFEWINLYATPIGRDSKGCIRYTAVFSAVSKEFSLYQEMLNLSENGLMVTDRDTRELYFANETAKEILDFIDRANGTDKEQQASGRNIYSGLMPDRFVARKETIAGRTYQIYPHNIEWMGRPSVAQYFSDISEEIELQEKLAAEEERYRMVAEESNIALMDYDVLNGKLYANDLFKQYAIYRSNDTGRFTFQESMETVHEEDREKIREFYSQLQKSGKAAAGELRLLMQDGTYRWSELHGIEVGDETGNIVRRLCFIRDIDAVTEQYRQLQIRYDYEIARLNSFEEDIVEKIHLDLTDDRVIRAGRRGNLPLDILVGKTTRELLQMRLLAEPDEKNQQKIAEFMNRERLLQASDTMEIPVLEIKTSVAGTSEKKYYRSIAKTAKNPVDGHVIAFLETRDIDKEKTEEILMRRLLETNYETAFLVHSTTGKIKLGIRRGDAAFATDVEMTYDELMNRDIDNTVMRENQAQVRREMKLSAILEKLGTMPLCSGRAARRENGKIAYKMWTAAYFDEEKEYVIITTSNVTEVYQKDLEHAAALKEALENAEVASRAKTTFLARMSHEIRTPITTVSGTLELIRRDCAERSFDAETLMQRIDTASTANQYLLTLINDILDMAKIESNELVITPTVAKMKSVVNPILAMIRPMAEKKNIRLIWERKTYTSDWYRMDTVRLSQILMNLLSNAVKFSPEGGKIVFSGETKRVKDEKAIIKFTVTDNGVGIADEFKRDVFEPFKQEYTDMKSGYGGSGIGLAISRSLARLMDGDITFESRKGQGATFIATVRLDIVSPQEETVSQVQNTDLRLDTITVLLCEDNEINQMIAKELLEHQGCRVLTADDGEQGVKLFADSEVGSIQCILMDVRMPNMDGLEAARKIRSLPRKDACKVPIIAMSANAYEEDKQMSLKAGMNDHLCKPVNPKVLYQTIQNYISASR